MILSRLRLLTKTASHFRLLSNLSAKSPTYPRSALLNHHHHQQPPSFLFRFLSTSNYNGSSEDDIPVFSDNDSGSDDIPVFSDNDAGSDDNEDSWLSNSTAVEDDEYQPWSFAKGEGDKKISDVFDIGEEEEEEEESVNVSVTPIKSQIERDEEEQKAILLEKEKEELTAVLKGPNRAFGDLIAASGITDDMLDSLLALKDFEGIKGLPPLHEIEDERYENSKRKSVRSEMELRKQEEVAKSRVRRVDDKGRAYGTGRRKCSIARVWIQPGDGQFLVNDKEFDVYFPMLDHRAALLQPFSETKTLGLWDIKCTVKGGGVSGQVGAISLGVSRALQNWEPDLRPALRAGGLLTRDPRVVERKKPGKAKARKSFQWVKR